MTTTLSYTFYLTKNATKYVGRAAIFWMGAIVISVAFAEVGVSFQNHISLHKRLARKMVCFDIYRDQRAIDFYAKDPSILYALMNVSELPLRESSVDALLTTHVVEHFPDRARNLRRLHWILKAGSISCHVVPTRTWVLLGHLLETVLNILTLRPRIGARMHGEFESLFDEIRSTSVKAWRKQFESCGFTVVTSAPGTLGLYPLPFRLTAR